MGRMKYKEHSCTITTTVVLSTLCYKLFLNHISYSQTYWIMANSRFLMCNPWPKSPVSSCQGLFLSCSLASSGQFASPGEGRAPRLVFITNAEVRTSGCPCKPDDILLHEYLFLVTCKKLFLLPVLSLADHPAFPQQLIFFFLVNILFSFLLSGTHL